MDMSDVLGAPFEPMSPKAFDSEDAPLEGALSLARAARVGFRPDWGLEMWRTMKPRSDSAAAQVDRVAAKLVQNKGRYKPVEAVTRVPWFFIAAVHWRENNADFRGVLHNGERIIGTGRRTNLVPRGRGPFWSWEEAAVDALRHMKLDRIDDPDDADVEWTLARLLYELERYNGFGYIGKTNSPYVWSFSNHYNPPKGKYVRDGVFDRNAVDKQIGTAMLLQRMARVDAEVDSYLRGDQQQPEPEPDVIDAIAVLQANLESLTKHRIGVLLLEPQKGA